MKLPKNYSIVEMKLAITNLSIFLFLTIAWVSCAWFTREEWQTKKRCAECEALKNQKQQRLIGTVEILSNGKNIFTDQLTGLTYNLIPCDVNCESKELLPFGKIGIKDYATRKQIYFDIEGKYISEIDEVVYSFVIVLNERIFVNPEEIKEVTFDEIKEKYTALEEETFLLNESHHAGLRAFLPYYYSEQQLKQPIPIKEATWETSDSTLITVWFEQKPIKQNEWTPIESYQWKKGTEF
ncbi:hypothetical protein [Solitalea lacus]|uniref:hypothetical protein n=1 Tax=Solitalea lacus TaxID=2911172 RepID=UPI001EDC6EE2|nr:hypothetical protein [Solitalea lacus]UKJ09007.1 hypothetical protein L2B55_07515 [Solitalea lacus]